MSRTMIFPVGDTARDFLFQLSDANGPSDLNGVTLTLRLKDKNTGAAAITAAVTPVNPAAAAGDPDRGWCSVAGAVRAAWVAGEYFAEVEGVFVGGARDIWPTSEKNSVIVRALDT